MFVGVEREDIDGIADLAGIQVFDAVLGAQDDVAIVVDGILGEVDVAVQTKEARHELVCGVGIFREFGVGNDSECDKQGFYMDEQGKYAISAAEPAAQRRFGEQFDGPTFGFEDATDVFKDHRALSSEFFALRQRE